MINYATYRIAETIALLGFLAIAILAFQVYPVTAIMIVLLAILNDFAIISIAYDNTHYSNKPETWDMRLVMGIAIALGVFATFRSFGIFYLGDRLFHLDPETLRTLVYLNLSIGGHLTVFAARTRGAFWPVRPSRVLLGAVFGTQAAATLIAVNGVLMSAISWQMAGIVWGYCGALFLLQDRVKLFAHQVLNRHHSGFLTKQTIS
jgi:H+-transporting ATPase